MVHLRTVGRELKSNTEDKDYILLYLFSSASVWPLSSLDPIVSSSPL